MSADGSVTPGWTVELGTDAARSVRDAEPVVQRRLVAVLDEMAREGVPPGATRVGSSSYAVRSGDVEAVVRVDSGSRSIVVARLAMDRPPARDALRAAWVPAVVSSRIARHVDEVWAETRTTLRGMRRSPGFVGAVVATLALALGGTITMVGLADTVFKGALPFQDDHELLRLRDRQISLGGAPRIFNMSPLDFSAIRDETTTLAGVAAAGGVNHVLTGGEVSQRVNVIRVSEGWAALLGIPAHLGRHFSDREERLGTDAQVALLSHALWESRFGSDPRMVGRRIEYDSGVLTVVGVMPERFRYPYDADLWIPWRWDPTDGTSHDLNVVARMASGVTLDAVREELDGIALRLQASRPDTNADLFLNAETLRENFISDQDDVLLALVAAVGFLLLLACVNVTNLMVARFVGRSREVGIRAALGAGRVREIRGFMIESVLLFLAGGLIGLAIAFGLGDLLSVLVPDVMRTQLNMDGLEPDLGLLAFALLLSLLAGLAVGLTAALKGTSLDVSAVLKDGGRGGSARGARVQRLLVIAQLALSVSLLAGAGVLLEHFRRLNVLDLGLDADGLYTMRVSVEQDRFAEPDARLDVVQRLQSSITAVPGVASVAYTTVNPFCCGNWGARIAVESQPQPEGTAHLIHHRLVGPGYFTTTGTPLLRGRDFDARDVPGSPPVVIVDQALADRFWPGEEAIGRRVRMDRPGTEWHTIVGVVGDVAEEGDYTETWYLPYTQDPIARSSGNLHFMIRADDPTALESSRRAVRSVHPDLAVYGLSTMRSVRAELISQDRLGAAVGTAFATFGLLLAALGVFGMLSYAVSLRSREMGTRIALGAHPAQVTALVMNGAWKLTGGGVVLGLFLALGLNQVLQRVIFGGEPAGPILLVGLTALVLLVSSVAALVPAIRAARIDPIRALSE